MGIKSISILFVVVALAVGGAVFQNCSKLDENSETVATTGSFRMYYLLEANYSCVNGTKSSLAYKGKIGYDKEIFRVYGDGCSKTHTDYAKSTPGFSVSETEIIYQGATYLYFNRPPEF